MSAVTRILESRIHRAFRKGSGSADAPRAAINGDRSENADYQYGKRRLREIDRRIRFLTKRIDAAEVVDPEGSREGDRVVLRAPGGTERLEIFEVRYERIEVKPFRAPPGAEAAPRPCPPE